jgi:hypothetical protein
MNSTVTVDLLDGWQEAEAPATGSWSRVPESLYDTVLDLSHITKVAGLALVLGVSTFTAAPDLWLLEKRRRDAVVTASIYKEVLGRPISRNEALRISRQILEEAERERLAFAEWESARGIRWEDET